MRDSQRSKVYRAEQVLNSIPEANKRYEDMATLAARVDAIWKSRTVAKLLPRVFMYAPDIPLTVRDGRGRTSAAAHRRTLWFPRWSRKEWVLLHEMAHVIRDMQDRSNKTAAHGHEFCAIYLKLVRRFIGKSAYDALRASFKKYRVRYTPPRKITPERLVQLREQGRRLAATRNLS